jgi:hypothetical protein
MNRDDRNRLTELRDSVELAELEILSMSPSDFAKINAANLTAGQIITLASLVDAFSSIRSFQSVTPGSDVYPSPATSEQRSGLFSGSAGSPTREEVKERVLALLAGKFAPDQEISTVNGPVRYADVPKDENGDVPAEWVDANCTCDEHERKRIEADRNAAEADPFAYKPGQYL